MGYHVADALCQQLGIELAGEAWDDDQMTGHINVMWMQQLVPELSELMVAYDLVIFVDAHTGVQADDEDIRVTELVPAYRSALVSHHIKPETLLAMARDLYGRLPRAIAVSVRGRQFDFDTQLSAGTMELASEALRRVSFLVSAAIHG